MVPPCGPPAWLGYHAVKRMIIPAKNRCKNRSDEYFMDEFVIDLLKNQDPVRGLGCYHLKFCYQRELVIVFDLSFDRS